MGFNDNRGKGGNNNGGNNGAKNEQQTVLFKVDKRRVSDLIYSVYYISVGEVIGAIKKIMAVDNQFGEQQGFLGISPNYSKANNKDNPLGLPTMYMIFKMDKCPLISYSRTNCNTKGLNPVACQLLQQSGKLNGTTELNAFRLFDAINGLFVNFEEYNQVNYEVDYKAGILAIEIDIRATLMAIHKIDPTGASGSEFIDILKYTRMPKMVDSYIEFYMADLDKLNAAKEKYSGYVNKNPNKNHPPKFNIM